MEDRGEKIVNLAREMLSSARESGSGLPYETETRGLSLRTLFLAVLLTAFGSSAVTQWIDEAGRPINHYERIELDALMYYAARARSMDEELLRQNLRERLTLKSLENISTADFRRARALLHEQII